VAERVRIGGHNIPIDVIRRRYHRGVSNLFTVYMPIVNAWSVRDTSRAGSIEIARYNDLTGETILDEVKWKVIKSI
jgi:predicted ABC-type ATPase